VSTKNFISYPMRLFGGLARYPRRLLFHHGETKMRRTMMMLAAAGLFVSTAAQADVRIDARQADLQRQIDAGKRSGKLSRAERNTLDREQLMIKREEARLRARGRNLSERDEQRIGAMLDVAQRNITRLKNNNVRGRTGIHL